MELCKGFEDWLACLKCPNLCTKECPIEGEDVVEEMKRQIRLLSISGMTEDGETHSKEHDKWI
ncbi:MAG: hypothetical protein AB1348_06035 [Nitrospirota bacterium]